MRALRRGAGDAEAPVPAGATVEVGGELYGTLCFASTEPRDEPIADRENRTDVTVAGTTSETLQTALRHNHLPKLASAGLVDWDPETGRIEPGPDHASVEPLLDALAAHADGLRPDWTDGEGN